MKILFVNPIAELGGAERSLLDLAWSLQHSTPDVQLELLTFSRGPLTDQAESLGVRPYVLPLPESLHRLGESGERKIPILGSLLATGPATLRFIRELRIAIRELRPDIVHSNGLKSHVLAALAQTTQPLIWHLHDFISRRFASRVLLTVLQRRPARAVAVSKAVADDARQVLRKVRIETVLGAIRTELFRTSGPGLDLDALAGMPPARGDLVRVGLVATYARWKGQNLFLEAVSRLRDRNARFYVVGGPIYGPAASQWSKEALMAMIDELGISHYCGLVPFQADAPGVYRALDIVVHASTQPEPFGRTVSEALASGRAVVGADAGGVPEQLRSGIEGLLFASDSSDSLALAIRRLIDDPNLRERLGRAGAERARAILDVQRVGPAMLQILSIPICPAAGRQGRRARPSLEASHSGDLLNPSG